MALPFTVKNHIERRLSSSIAVIGRVWPSSAACRPSIMVRSLDSLSQNLRSSSCGVGMALLLLCAGGPTNRGAPTLHAAKSGHDPATSPHRRFDPAAAAAERQ